MKGLVKPSDAVELRRTELIGLPKQAEAAKHPTFFVVDGTELELQVVVCKETTIEGQGAYKLVASIVGLGGGELGGTRNRCRRRGFGRSTQIGQDA